MPPPQEDESSDDSDPYDIAEDAPFRAPSANRFPHRLTANPTPPGRSAHEVQDILALSHLLARAFARWRRRFRRKT